VGAAWANGLTALDQPALIRTGLSAAPRPPPLQRLEKPRHASMMRFCSAKRGVERTPARSSTISANTAVEHGPRATGSRGLKVDRIDGVVGGEQADILRGDWRAME